MLTSCARTLFPLPLVAREEVALLDFIQRSRLTRLLELEHLVKEVLVAKALLETQLMLDSHTPPAVVEGQEARDFHLQVMTRAALVAQVQRQT